MKTMLLRVLAVVVVLTPAMVFTQGAKTRPTTATYITKEEIDLVNKEGQGTDRNIRTVVIGRHNPSPDLNGPTCGGMAYEAVKKQVKTGDIIIVPAGVVHGWLDIPEHVDYLSFRPSPGILTAGWVHPVLRK